jgi:hypothetical protein
MDHDDAATVAASLSEISEAILRLATEIKNKDIRTTIIVDNNSEAEEVEPQPKPRIQELRIEDTKVSDEKPESQLQLTSQVTPSVQAQVQPRVQTTPSIPPGVRACRVESQIRIREADGQYWIISVRTYTDGVCREDRKLWRQK